ncbi:Zinc-binding domain present in Lin-11, Isl-1, Mec-3 [Rhizoctonia solani]|uniref:Zinc-binding domain present in Lin-11, Isl-1, Mec-3 n=1 Tax=Rhizoctonia solani TaxID=456999 RepID=A0A8H7IH55_9AGAM|nr:Zinc-binding domain present in Lin-11, Isl-1, Mec-3 [Rhizoctonia solani]
MHTRPPSQTFSVFNSNGTARSQAYTPTHTYSYSNSNSNSNSYISSSNTHLHSHPHSHSHTHSNPPLHSSAMSRSPAKQPGGCLTRTSTCLRAASTERAGPHHRRNSRSTLHARPGLTADPAASLQPMANGNSSPGRSPSPSPSPGYLAPHLAPVPRLHLAAASWVRPLRRLAHPSQSQRYERRSSPLQQHLAQHWSQSLQCMWTANDRTVCSCPRHRLSPRVFPLQGLQLGRREQVLPIDGPDGRQHPLCERDYFKRLNLICASATWPCETKSTMSSTLHVPSVRPYLVHKTRIMSTRARSFVIGTIPLASPSTRQRISPRVLPHPQGPFILHFIICANSSFVPSSFGMSRSSPAPRAPHPSSPEPFDSSSPAPTQLTYIAEEQQTTAQSLKAAQVKMEAQVYAIWTNLSAFEESSAACISDMLTQVSAGIYLDAIRMAEKFILHVEVLFAAIDEIEDRFAALSSKALGQGMSQELLALVTGLAHYLKILIRIALTGSLKLERELGDGGIALGRFLERMKALAKSGGDVRARRLSSPPNEPNGNDPSDSIVAYGYRSLAPEVAGESPRLRAIGDLPAWHTTCIKCAQDDCTRTAVAPLPPHLQAPEKKPDDEEGGTKKVSSVRRPPAEVGRFIYEPSEGEPVTVAVIYCTDHGTVPPCRSGFEAVSRLEQYAFLLNVALRRLFLLLKKRGAIGIEVGASGQETERYGQTPQALDHCRKSDGQSGPANRRRGPKEQRAAPGLDYRHGPLAPPSQAGSMHHVPLTNSVPVTLRQPTPRAPNQIQTQAQVQAQAQQVLPQSQGESPTGVLRPPFARNNTQVRIVDDSLLVEAEQRRSLPRQGSRRMIAELGPLEQLVVKHAAVQSLLRTPIRDAIDMDELGELLELKKNTFWGKLFKAARTSRGSRKKGFSGCRWSCLSSARGGFDVGRVESDGAGADVCGGYSVCYETDGHVRHRGDRSGPNVGRIRPREPGPAAALLKKFLREMPDPLLTYRLYKVWLAVQSVNASDKEKTRMLHLVTILLPKSHRDTLEVLFVFLKWVSLFSHVDEETGSKMDLVNLATVITPSILYSKGRDAAREESFMAIGVVTRLLEDQDQFFSVPDDFLWFLGNMEIWSGCLDLPMRDMQRRVENVMTRRRQQPSPSTNNQGPQPQQGYLPSGGPRSDSHTSIPTRPSDQNLARGRQGSNPLDVRPPPRINGNGNAGRSQSTERSQAPPQSAPPHPGLGHAPMSYPPPGVPSQQTPPSPRMTPREGPQPWKSPSRPPSQVMARPSMDYIQSQPSDRYPPPSQ